MSDRQVTSLALPYEIQNGIIGVRGANMNDIVRICNENQGFISAILTVMTILISVIAIFSSHRVGKIPYKKKLAVIPTYESVDEPVIDVMLVNYGLMPLVISHIAIYDAKRSWVGGTSVMKPIVLEPSKSKRFTISIQDRNGLIEKYAIDLNRKMTIEVCEYGGTKHKFNKGFPVG